LGASGHYWDPEANRWGKVSIKQTKQIKMGANSGMIYDPKRKLFWAVEGYDRSGPYVMKLDFDKAK
jgi:hypothetical protein